jgi:hypothetical protein
MSSVREINTTPKFRRFLQTAVYEEWGCVTGVLSSILRVYLFIYGLTTGKCIQAFDGEAQRKTLVWKT